MFLSILIPTKNAILSIIIVGFLVFSVSVGNGFVWDDEEQIVLNTAVHSASSIPGLFAGSTFNSGGSGSLGGMYYKPVMSVFFALLYSLFGPSPGAFHLFQVLIHTANAVLFYLILKRILGEEKGQPSLTAFIISLLFLVHPMVVETVVYSSALQDTLFFFFGMIALYLAGSINKHNHLWLYPLLGIFLLLSLLSKETGLVCIIITGLWFWLFGKGSQRLYVYGTMVFVVLNIYGLLRFAVAKVGLHGAGGLSPIMRAGVLERLTTVPKIIWYYLSNFVAPIKLAIAQHWVVRTVNWSEFWWPALVTLMACGLWVAGWRLVRLRPKLKKEWWFFTVWTVAGMALHLQLFPLDMTVADRWFYLPLAGLLGLVSLVLEELGRRTPQLQKILLISFSFIICIFAVRSQVRVTNWKNGLTLFAHDIQMNQEAFDLENNLGVELIRAGQMEKAKGHFERSVELAPYWWTNYNNLGVVYQRQGDLAEAERLYRQAITNGHYYLAYENLVVVLYQQGKIEELKTFLVKEALPLFPYNQNLRTMWMVVEKESTPGSRMVQ